MNPFFSPSTASKVALLVAALIVAAYLTEVTVGGQTQEVSPAENEEEQLYDRPDEDPDYVNPQEIRDVTKQFKELRREIKRTLKMLVKVPNSGEDKGKLNGLLEQLSIWERNLRTPPADMTQREVMQEFYDANVWDDINNVRRKAELPKNIRDGEKSLARVEKLLKKPRTQKYLADLTPKMAEYLGIIRSALETAKVALASGDLESAEEAMQTTYENHPGEVEGIIHMMTGIREGLKRIKDAEIKAIVEELLEPINESLAQGEYRDANQALNEVQEDISRVIELASRARQRRPKNFDEKLRRLEDLLQQKFGGQEGEEILRPAERENSVSRPYLGGWRVEKVFGLDAQGQWSESALPPHNPTYVEFDNESSCVTEAADRTCTTYDRYQVDGNIISFPFPGAASSRLIWSMAGEKLEIVHEGLVENAWVPNVKFVSVKVK